MKRLFAAALFVFAPPCFAAEPPDDGPRLMAEFGLRESPKALKEDPRWRKPKRIVVDAEVPGLLEVVREAAGDVSVVAAKGIDELSAAMTNAGSDVLIGRTAPICAEKVVSRARDLRWLQTIYSGVERCMGRIGTQLQSRNVRLTNMRAVSSVAIAEQTWAMLLAMTRQLTATVPAQRERIWLEAFPENSRFVSLSGKTMLVVGLGGIGSEIARRAPAFGLRVLATRATRQPTPPFVDYVGSPEELPALVPQADVVVNAAPLTAATQGLFDAELFRRMKPGSYFINIARSGAVVHPDLIAALRSGHLAGAALDVFDQEPLPRQDPLWSAPNLVITPHVAGRSDSGNEPTLRVIRENLRRYVQGRPLLSEVDFSKEY